MTVMTAGMHAAFVERCVRGTGFFMNRKSVHIRAESYCLLLSEIEEGDKSGFYDFIDLAGEGG